MRGRLLVVGAGWEQRPLVERALRDGFEVVCAGASNELDLDGVEASVFVDPRDLSSLRSVVSERQIDFVASDEDDYARYAQAWLADTLELPGPSLESVAPTVDKVWLRGLCEARGIPQPRYGVVRTLSEAQSFVRFGWPLIVKPADNRGSIGVVRVDNVEQLGEAVADALANSHSRQALVEKYIDGTVVTVDGAHLPSGHVVLGVASKVQVLGRQQVAMEVTYPALLTEEAAALARHRANEVAELFRERGASGLTHTEFLFDGTEMWLLESANRGGGVFTSNVIVPAHSGFDTTGLLLTEAVGESPSGLFAEGSGAAVILSFLPMLSGRVAQIRGFEEASSAEGVLAARMNVTVGDVVRPVSSALSRAGFLIVEGSDVADAQRRLAAALSMIHIQVDP